MVPIEFGASPQNFDAAEKAIRMWAADARPDEVLILAYTGVAARRGADDLYRLRRPTSGT